MDRKTVIAIALCVLFLIAYQPLLRMVGLGHYVDPPRRPQMAAVDSTAAAPDSAASPVAVGINTPPDPAQAETPGTLSGLPIQAPVAALERSIAIETPLYRAVFSSRGGRLMSVALKKYASAFGESGQNGEVFHAPNGEDVPPSDRVVLAGTPTFTLGMRGAGGADLLAGLEYAVEESLGVEGQIRALTFTAADSGGFRIRQTYRVRPQDYAFDYEVEMQGVPAGQAANYSLETRSWPLFTEEDREADVRGLRASSLVGTNVRREGIGGIVKEPKVFEGNVRWAGVQNRYFIAVAAVVDANPVQVVSGGQRIPLTAEQRAMLPPNAKNEQDVVTNALEVRIPPAAAPVNRFLLYFGPTEYGRMAELGQGLDRTVDLGWRWLEPFSKALLVVMKWLYGVLHNYGVAIVVLATLVRVVLHPLNMASMKSMRAMQKLQPEMERIRTKYKDNPQAMNTAMMALYKEHKVNPAGGCLPMLLQMPLFIALYSVLFNAIELRQAPFFLWMNDLSAPDRLFDVAGFPIRLLPLLMAGSGYLQMKMMPQTPQAGMPNMSIMNLVMLVFFYNLPSGLVLYWTIMNVLTILQQWMMLREDSPQPAGSHAVVVETEPARKGGRRRRMAK